MEHLASLPVAGRVITSAAAFAVYHFSMFQLVPTFLLGVLLAIAVHRLGALWPAIVAHSTFNVIGLLLTSLAAGDGGLP